MGDVVKSPFLQFFCFFFCCCCKQCSLCVNNNKATHIIAKYGIVFCILGNKKFFELKSKGYRDGIKRKETR